MKKFIFFLTSVPTFLFVLTITLSPTSVCNVVVNETGTCWNTIQDGINNATDGQTVVIINSSIEYNESIVVNRSITLTSNTSSPPTIFKDIASISQATIVNITKGNSTVTKV